VRLARFTKAWMGLYLPVEQAVWTTCEPAVS